MKGREAPPGGNPRARRSREMDGRPDEPIIAYIGMALFGLFCFLGVPNIMACAHMAGWW